MAFLHKFCHCFAYNHTLWICGAKFVCFILLSSAAVSPFNAQMGPQQPFAAQFNQYRVHELNLPHKKASKDSSSTETQPLCLK